MMPTVGLTAAYWLNFPGALSAYEGRYLYASTVPLLLLGDVQLAGGSQKKFQIMATVLLMIALEQSLLLFPGNWTKHIKGRQQTTLELTEVARFCSQNISPDDTILMHDAGYLAFATDRHFVDFVGLKTSWYIPYHERLTFPSEGAERAEAVSQIAQRAGLNIWQC